MRVTDFDPMRDLELRQEGFHGGGGFLVVDNGGRFSVVQDVCQFASRIDGIDGHDLCSRRMHGKHGDSDFDRVAANQSHPAAAYTQIDELSCETSDTSDPFRVGQPAPFEEQRGGVPGLLPPHP